MKSEETIMATIDFRGQGAYQFPHRKPVTAPHIPANNGGVQPLTKIVPDVALPSTTHQPPTSMISSFSFPRRTTQPPTSSATPSYQNTMNTSRRTPSTSTTSTANTGYIPNRTPSTASSTVSRTASTRSGASMTPTSYVALMRKQKATVWCDRAQHEDPRIVAQQKAAKLRAAREVSGGNMEGRSSNGSMGSGSLGVRSKIRHHGVPKAQGYSSANIVGGGVPLRLSATEVGEEENDNEDNNSQRNTYHERTDSGRSSLASNKHLNPRQFNRYSEGTTPTSAHGSSPGTQGSSPNEGVPELDETPVPGNYHGYSNQDYFGQPSGQGGSGGSSERESSFGNIGQLNAPTGNSAKREEGKSAEELRRRGSVDERANTLSGMAGVRLFVANPDLSD